jgi:hypothetical protein
VQPIRAGRLEGYISLGLGNFRGIWYGVEGDTAEVRLEEVVQSYSTRIAPFEGLTTEWALPIFLRGENFGLGVKADRLNSAMHNWMDMMLARQIDSFHVAQINERRMFEKELAARNLSGGSAPPTNRNFILRARVCWCSRELVSVMLDYYDTYTGVREFEGWTYQISGDTIRRFRFSDLFRKGVDIRRTLHEWGKRTSMAPIDTAFTALVDPAADNASYERIVRSFVISPGGITFFLPDPFSPFGALGPLYSIEIPWRELKGVIDPDGLLGQLK